MSSTTSFAANDISILLVVSGWVVLLSIVIHASLFHGYPYSQLGRRPIQGRGLLEYIYYGSLLSQIGVWGYDPIQGAFSPLLRFFCHCSIILMLWGCGCWTHYILYTTTNVTAAEISNFHNNTGILLIGVVVLMVYLIYCYTLFHVLPGVSVPSGPRPHKIQRIPQWYNQYWDINTCNKNQSTNDMEPPTSSAPSSSSPIHRYVHGQESHSISEQIHNSNQENNDSDCTGITTSNPLFHLTGEPAGRDMWTTTSTQNKTQETIKHNTAVCVSDDMIQALASGGRPYTGFNPSINPNRFVIIIIHI